MEAQHKFDRLLAYHCAPTLAGAKPASMLSYGKHHKWLDGVLDRYNAELNVRGAYLEILCECKKHVLIIVYDEAQLTKALCETGVGCFLRQYGYQDCTDIRRCLHRVGERIASQQGFPHEIGIFLGYPLQDVMGFIHNKGRNYKMCGCWKVYSNAEQAQKTFDIYAKHREQYSECLKMGIPLLALCTGPELNGGLQ